ncbi:hypothetical protein IEZ26_03565 [Nocardioides cavernae]|uniref:Uncharacterized protein n=1 Tax=Nocardioides cavernae TaxID=1921566 RepID=A0ABR8N802_9ACTN|nr:hypothetical protein [Nocardioides cavernae]MBD3923686.1 hypothetical protein [Nocardioides cavernae]MBM7511381.1 hypothetical protein [Nocardioides cavernae]
MSTDDTGVTELLRRASDGLTPNVDRLVSGGIARGRAHRRRARIGTTVASLAVIGVVGGVAVVVPRLGEADSASSGVADRPDAVTSRAADPDRPPPADELRALVDPDAMATTLLAMTGASRLDSYAVDATSADLQRVAHVVVDGAEVSFRIRWYNNPLVVADGGEPLPPSHVCDPAPDTDCTTLPDGSRLLREEVRPAGGTGVPTSFQERTLTLATADGWQIDVIARNTSGEKEGSVMWDQPVLTMEEMQAIATSDAWYE